MSVEDASGQMRKNRVVTKTATERHLVDGAVEDGGDLGYFVDEFG